MADTPFRSKFSIIFLPREWTEQLNLRGDILLGGLGLMQIIGALRPATTISYMDHLFGMIVGISIARWWSKSQEQRKDALKKTASVGVWERLFGNK